MSQIPSIAVSLRCDRGLVRPENQDAVLHQRTPLGDLLLVADGVGGYSGGAVASSLVVDSIRRHLAAIPRDCPPEQALRQAVVQANAAIRQESTRPGSPYPRMGSTVVAALVQRLPSGSCAFVAHVGDSRAYLGRAGSLTQLTRDHSAVQAMLDDHLITPEQAAHHPDAHVLTRSLGHAVEVEPEIACQPIQAGDTLLLCSDGLWGFVAAGQMEHTALDPALSTEAAAQTLLSLALAAGGRDNIGLILARFGPSSRLLSPRSPAAPAARRPRKRGSAMLAAALVTVFALTAVALIGLQLNWFDRLRPGLNPTSPYPVPASVAGSESPDPVPHTFALVYADGAGQLDIPHVSGWTRAEVAPERYDSCRIFAGVYRRITIFYEGSDPALADRFARRNLAVFGDRAFDLDRRPVTDDLRAACGRFELIAFIPAGSTLPGTKTPRAAR